MRHVLISGVFFVRMANYHQEKVEKLLARHTELEQSETKAQATLVTILSLTQITELKLLLDIGRSGHSFYDFVLTLLLASVCLEIFIGIIIIYIGNLHYYHATYRIGRDDVTSGCSLPGASSPAYRYDATMKRLPTSGDCDLMTGSRPSHGITGIVVCDRSLKGRLTSTAEIEHLEANIELAQIKMADIELKTSRASNYIRVLEKATPGKSPGNADLLEELRRARNDLSASRRERDEAEAEQRAAEAEMHRGLVIKRQEEDREESATFRWICHWQRIATYALYFVMIMNIFITTFGISGGNSRVFLTRSHHVHSHVVVPLPLPPQSASSALNTTNHH